MGYALGRSKVVSVSTTIIATAARILGIGIKAGTDAASVKVMDGGSGGTQKYCTIPVASGTFDRVTFPDGIQCSTDIYATITGTSPEVAVLFED
jgi:hypothetical protein